MNIKSSHVCQDDITSSISSVFDYPFDGRTVFSVPLIPQLPEQFGIGAIVGPSGSGKSSILYQMGAGQSEHKWSQEKAICSHFESSQDAIDRLSAVGFNSVPSWLRPYHVLSTGEKFRADLAIGLKSNAVFDEFTSTVDRNVAKACCYAVRRYVDKKSLSGIVVASCHYDILDWLQPDWVYDTATGRLAVGRSERRPEIFVEVVPCTTGMWPIFRNHHYLSGSINQSARCWVATWKGSPVGFASAIAFPNGAIQNAWREHRTVILPDFQGLGIGVRLSDSVAWMFRSQGCRYFSKTAHPRLGSYRDASPLWRATSKNHRARNDYKNSYKTKEDAYKMHHAHRVCYSHEFIG